MDIVHAVVEVNVNVAGVLICPRTTFVLHDVGVICKFSYIAVIVYCILASMLKALTYAPSYAQVVALPQSMSNFFTSSTISRGRTPIVWIWLRPLDENDDAPTVTTSSTNGMVFLVTSILPSMKNSKSTTACDEISTVDACTCTLSFCCITVCLMRC